MQKRIYFTGASGKAGKHAAAYLIKQGYRVLNADITQVNQEGLDYLKVDITDLGQVFSSMSAHMNRDELRQQQTPLGYDAVVHFAAIPRILQVSDIETYRVNVMGTYNVIEAAIKLGIKKIILPHLKLFMVCVFHMTSLRLYLFQFLKRMILVQWTVTRLQKLLTKRPRKRFSAVPALISMG